jgi:hypothetical protein
MEEAEVPLEHLHEHVKETAEHSGITWISWAALSTAILAVLAAIAGLLSGQHANEAMMNQIEASDQWNYYQAKSIKASVLDAKMSLTSAPNESDQSKRDRYEKEQEEIKSEAEHKQAAAKSNFHKHEVFARGVTMFQITIAIAESPLLQGNATSGLSVCSSDLSAAPFSSSPRSRIRGDLPHSPCA